MTALGFIEHDHLSCIAAGVAQARAQCETTGQRLTPLRQRVLEILLEHHRALGAYDVLDQLRADGLASQPPAAYRALDFLVAGGFAHRIERLNAFVACSHSGRSHTPTFLICRACRAVAEAPEAELRTRLMAVGAQAGFTIENTVIEAVGLCRNCEDAP